MALEAQRAVYRQFVVNTWLCTALKPKLQAQQSLDQWYRSLASRPVARHVPSSPVRFMSPMSSTNATRGLMWSFPWVRAACSVKTRRRGDLEEHVAWYSDPGLQTLSQELLRDALGKPQAWHLGVTSWPVKLRTWWASPSCPTMTSEMEGVKRSASTPPISPSLPRRSYSHGLSHKQKSRLEGCGTMAIGCF